MPQPPATSEQTAALEAKVRSQDETIRELREQMNALARQYQDLARRVNSNAGGSEGINASPMAAPRRHVSPIGLELQVDDDAPLGQRSRAGAGAEDNPPEPRSGNGGVLESIPRSDRTREGGAGARDNPAEPLSGGGGMGPVEDLPRSDRSREGGAGARDNPAEPLSGRLLPGEGALSKLPLKAYIGPGFELITDDEEFQLQFHNLTQLDLRLFQQANPATVRDGFYIPRQRWYFMGRLTKPIEYYVSIDRGFGALDLLDCFINYHYDDRLMFKMGRFKTPYTYEYYAISVQDLMAPERSLYNVNYSLNRQYGFMGWGQLFDKRLDYAAGVFNGPRRSFEDFNNEKDVMAYLNYKPFGSSERYKFLQNLNLSASTDFGNQNDPLTPLALKTAANPSNNPGALLASPSFLTFNNNIMEIGNRDLWDLSLAYYYKGLSLLGAWDWGFTDYAPAAAPRNKTRLPVTGYFVQAAYFLTGEEVLRRSQVKPLHPFDLRKGKFGTGAIEVHSRFSEIHLGQQVFTHGLADPNLWTNEAYAIDTGLNWYLNLYTKIYLDWQHAVYGNPVVLGPGQFQKTSDLFWIRCQIYF